MIVYSPLTAMLGTLSATLAAVTPINENAQFLIPDWAWVMFCFVLGASVGSFLTVVISRMPLGLSLVRPRSRCPGCMHRLTWYDNLPIITWLLLGGKCRYCKSKIGFIYPMIELCTAGLFAAWFIVCYMTDLRPGFSGPGIQYSGILFIPGLFLLAILVACTFIDAEHWIIPIGLPHVAAVAALILMPTGVWVTEAYTGPGVGAVRTMSLPQLRPGGVRSMPSQREKYMQAMTPYNRSAEVRAAIATDQEGEVRVSAAPLVDTRQAAAGIGGFVGLIIANLLLYLGVLPQSFDHVDEDEAGGPENWTPHPHPRREVLKEVMFITPAIIGGLIGYLVTSADAEPWSNTMLTFCGVLLGYLAGGAVVWILRILGTLGFGKEAMGLGDVHLMAGVGAVIGWQGAIAAFFIAPFFGIAYVLVTLGLSVLAKWEMKEIPFGPHLALATVVVMFFREPIVGNFLIYWHTITGLIGV
ncbi:MAG: hypothetical protein GC159_00545 [Phycisphaera sp.]|nr:hypothetical protein [Phycisphaera sp.]